MKYNWNINTDTIVFGYSKYFIFKHVYNKLIVFIDYNFYIR